MMTSNKTRSFIALDKMGVDSNKMDPFGALKNLLKGLAKRAELNKCDICLVRESPSFKIIMITTFDTHQVSFCHNFWLQMYAASFQ